MTQKEKAKAYDKAIEKLRSLHDDYDTISTLIDVKEELEEIFPELKETEDEKIRKDIISFLQLPHPQFVGKREQEKWIAWLEKQGEQKPVGWNVGEAVNERWNIFWKYRKDLPKYLDYLEKSSKKK